MDNITEKACLKLVFTTLRQTHQRWQRMTMSELERTGAAEVFGERFSASSLPKTRPGLALQR